MGANALQNRVTTPSSSKGTILCIRVICYRTRMILFFLLLSDTSALHSRLLVSSSSENRVSKDTIRVQCAPASGGAALCSRQRQRVEGEVR
ncbi:hypothetical protein C8Q78DRAFT_550365 [Trametes maxima]|nr:hypothetical protein C8Q78DRAFT_550365 [Trametes maxima]